jgi:hypothetical protein
MLEIYKELKERSQAARLERGIGWIDHPQALITAFDESARRFARYENGNEPFYPRARTPLTQRVQRGTTRVVAWLEANPGVHQVVGVPDLAFRYVDRELVCARTTGGVRFDDSQRSSATTATRLDLLLAGASDSFPIIGEIKVGQDKDALFALTQLLMLAVHLVTPAQRQRLATRYGDRLAVPEKGHALDLLIMLVDRPQRGRYRADLLQASDTLSERLMAAAAVSSQVRRIACVEGRSTGDGIEFAKLFAHTRPESAERG